MNEPESSKQEIRIVLDSQQIRTLVVRGAKITVACLCLAILAYFTFWIVSPYILAIVFGILVSRMFRPVHEWIRDRLFRKRWPEIAAGVSVATAFLVVVVPAGAVLALGGIKIASAIRMGLGWVDNGGLAQVMESQAGQWMLGNDLLQPLGESLQKLQLHEYFREQAQAAAKAITDNLGNIFKYGMTLALNMILFLLVVFHGFLRGDRLVQTLLYLVPVPRQRKEEVLHHIDETMGAVIGGGILTALLQAALAAIGFGACNLLLPHDLRIDLVWALVLGLAAFVPIIGTALVWGPISIYLLAQDYSGPAIFLAIYCGLVVSLVDNIARPLFIGKLMKGRPGQKKDLDFYVFLIFAILGGITVMGPPGIIFGPIILGLVRICIAMYKAELKNFLDQNNQEHANHNGEHHDHAHHHDHADHHSRHHEGRQGADGQTRTP